MTDISRITSSTDVSVLIDLIVKLDGQVGEPEEKLSQATSKNTMLVEEKIGLQTENAQLRAEKIGLAASDGASQLCTENSGFGCQVLRDAVIPANFLNH